MASVTSVLAAPVPARAPAVALAFEAPSAPPGAATARELREPGAYLGYEQQTTTFSYTRYDDRVRFQQGTGGFERRAMGERVGIVVR